MGSKKKAHRKKVSRRQIKTTLTREQVAAVIATLINLVNKKPHAMLVCGDFVFQVLDKKKL